jgi:transcriptional regulator of acetoin/glycerol metabolism
MESPETGGFGSADPEVAGTELGGAGIEVGAYSPASRSTDYDDVVVFGVGTGPHKASTLDSEDVVVFRPGMTMEELERQAIAAALSSVNGNRRKAAELLGIGERTLYRKISRYERDD